MRWTSYLTGALIIALLLAGKAISYLHDEKQSLESSLEVANATIEAKESTLSEMKAQLEEVHQLDTALNKELEDAYQQIESLERDVARGAQRVFVKASCPAPMPNQPTTASVVNERACELKPAARQDYFRLRREQERSRLQITGLQRYIRSLPSACVAGNQQAHNKENNNE
ncbi:lysis system i-spanin subunit Rz [Vibrio galatheae]|uniref:lysis system i-spanin subunit Rz n=1 Tax=Vibrio galatheae TaxID=579748 RepID=UPI000695EA62|nr:lysis system i-spanin subunit Rz [Vibrio galatheae]